MSQSPETHADIRPEISADRIERAIARGRRLQGEAVRQAFAGLLHGLRHLLRQGFFPARVRHRRAGQPVADCC